MNRFLTFSKVRNRNINDEKNNNNEGTDGLFL